MVVTRPACVDCGEDATRSVTYDWRQRICAGLYRTGQASVDLCDYHADGCYRDPNCTVVADARIAEIDA